MNMSNLSILILNGHPDSESYCSALANSYALGAKEAGHSVRTIHIRDLEFDPSLRFGYRNRTELEPALLEAQQAIKDAQHIVFVYPNWWGTFPSLLKGFIDRVFLPGFAFKYRSNSPLWDKLLTGKSARLLVTLNTPPWFYRLFYRSPGHHAIKKCVLQFCGINPVRITEFGIIKTANADKRKKWLDLAKNLGIKGI
jgi:NAD(P)H dehydrogenase (quinone)